MSLSSVVHHNHEQRCGNPHGLFDGFRGRDIGSDTDAQTYVFEKDLDSSGTLVIAIVIGRYLTISGEPQYTDEFVYARLGFSLAHGHLESSSSFLALYQRYGLNQSSTITPWGSSNAVEPWLYYPSFVPLLLVPILDLSLPPRVLPIIFGGIITILIYALLRDKKLIALSSTIIWAALFFSHEILSMLFLDAGVSFSCFSQYR